MVISLEEDMPDRLAEARRILDGLKVPYQQCSPYHIKVGRINFYSTGKVHLDGETKRLANGFSSWGTILKQEGYLKC